MGGGGLMKHPCGVPVYVVILAGFLLSILTFGGLPVRKFRILTKGGVWTKCGQFVGEDCPPPPEDL